MNSCVQPVADKTSLISLYFHGTSVVELLFITRLAGETALCPIFAFEGRLCTLLILGSIKMSFESIFTFCGCNTDQEFLKNKLSIKPLEKVTNSLTNPKSAE